MKSGSNFARIGKGVLRLAAGWVAVYAALWAYKRLLFPLIEQVFSLPAALAPTIGRAGTLLVMAVGYCLFVRFYEKRRATELAFKPRPIALGLLAGAGLIALPIFVLWLSGNYVMEAYRGFGEATYVITTIIVAAALEEFMFRGLLFRIIEEEIGTRVALITVSLIFGVMHLFNSGVTPITLVSVSLIGAMWCGVYAVSRNVWVAAVNHIAWNMVIFFSGITLSGQEEWRQAAPLLSHAQGSRWLTGGGFGPEDSVVTIGVVALAVWWLWPRMVRRRASL